jgi:hypothetical protein
MTDGIELSRLGLGTAPFGSSAGWQLWWGQLDASSAMATIPAAPAEAAMLMPAPALGADDIEVVEASLARFTLAE